TMVSPLLAAAIRSRSDPSPLSRLFKTVSVLGRLRSSSTSSRGTKVCLRAAGFLRRSWRTRPRPVRSEPEFQPRNQDARNIFEPPTRTGLRYNEKAIAPGAQTERPGDAGPVRASLGG